MSQKGERRCKRLLRSLVEAVETAIEIGDWKVDGRCDPTMALEGAKDFLGIKETEENSKKAKPISMIVNIPDRVIEDLRETANPGPWFGYISDYAHGQIDLAREILEYIDQKEETKE